MLLKLLEEYFRFSRKSRIAILFLLTAVLIVYVTLFILKNSYSPKEKGDFHVLYAQMDSMMLQLHDEHKRVYHLETFDPNNVTLDKLVAMGFKEKNAKTLVKFRTYKTFYNAEDIGKLYFVNEDLLEQLKPYMTFPAKTYKKKKEYGKQGKVWANKKSNFTKNKKAKFTGSISINSADTADFQKLHGIGSFLAKRIVQYRGKLGGFVKLDQLIELKYLRPETFDAIKSQLVLDPIPILKLNLNKAEWKEIIRHPYFNKEQTNAICNYRRKFGEILTFEELIENEILTSQELEKIKPYCVL